MTLIVKLSAPLFCNTTEPTKPDVVTFRLKVLLDAEEPDPEDPSLLPPHAASSSGIRATNQQAIYLFT